MGATRLNPRTEQFECTAAEPFNIARQACWRTDRDVTVSARVSCESGGLPLRAWTTVLEIDVKPAANIEGSAVGYVDASHALVPIELMANAHGEILAWTSTAGVTELYLSMSYLAQD